MQGFGLLVVADVPIDLFFMILDKNKYFYENTFGDKMMIRRITNNE